MSPMAAPAGPTQPEDAPPVSQRTPAGNDLDLYAEMAEQKITLRRLPALLRTALRLAWTADRPGVLLTSSAAVLGAVLAGVVVLAGARTLQALLDGQDGTADVSDVLLPGALLALATAAAAVPAVLVGQRQRLLGQRVGRAVMGQVLDVTVAVDLETFEHAAFFDRLQRVQANVLQRPVIVTTALTGLVAGLAGSLVLIATLFTLAPLLVLPLIAAGVPVILTGRAASRSEFRFTVRTAGDFRRRYYLQKVLSERDTAKEVRAFGLGPAVRARWEGLYDGYERDLAGQVSYRTRLALIGTTASAVLAVGAVGLLAHLVTTGRVGLAEAGASFVAVRLLQSRVGQVAGALGSLYESGIFLADLDTFLKLVPTAGRDPGATPVSAGPTAFETVTAEGLRFTYPGADRPAVDGVDLSLRAGEVVALVGENGSGKTTLAKLLASLYTAQEGRICWDGHDTRELGAAAVRERVAVIFQDFARYAMTAQENIGVGSPQRMDDLTAIERAARQAGAHRFLSTLPDGYQTFLSREFSGGVDLSLGQWQRVALARAFYRDAPLVVLDEPSSALDPRAEHELFNSVRTLLQGRTVLLITHRFSTVRDADRVLLMHEGRIVESGTHEELMRQRGRYWELYELQASAYDTADLR